jgi:hypothetical protein
MGTVPNVSTETTGITTTAPTLNSDLRDAFNFLLAPPQCTVTTTGTTTVASGTVPSLFNGWASTVVMNDGQWSSGTPSRLTAMTPGLYEISLYLHYSYVSFTGQQVAHCGIALNNGGAAWLNQNGANRLAEDTRVMSQVSALGTSIDIIVETFLNVNDYVEAYTAQTSGSNGTIASGVFNAAFGIRWVGCQ